MPYADFQIPSWEEMTTKQRKAAEYAWSRGELDVFVMPHQRPLWALICAHVGLPCAYTLPDKFKEVLGRTSTMKPLVIEVARRFGKSSLVLLAMMALCIRNKRHTYYFVAPVKEDAEDIIKDVYPPLIASCPPGMRPKELKFSLEYRNGSRIKIGGTFNGAEGLRGRAANGSAVDEAGSIPPHSQTSCLTYVISSILQPSLSTTRGWNVILTTPPPNMQHDYYKMAGRAEDEGRFIRMNINENTAFTEKEIDELHQASLTTDPTGGAWEREYMCHPKPDPRSLIIPEATQEILANNIVEYVRPAYFPYLHRYITIDHGTVDLNAILFGYYDYPQAKLIIEKEVALPGGPTTKQIARNIMSTRDSLWGRELPIERAICDAISQQLRIDLNSECGDLFFVSPTKTILLSDNGAREGMVNKLITGISDGQIVIDPSCKLLLETIRTATWKVSTTGKREFARFDEIGHSDFLAALMYMWMGTIRNVNPLAGKIAPDVYTTWMTKAEDQKDPKHVLGRAINRQQPLSIFARHQFKRR